MTIEYEIIENPSADSHLWKQWKHLVDTEQWSSDDNSTTLLTPSLKTTRSVFAVTKTPERDYIGSVVWNEYDDICFLGFFLLYPEYRGKGIGSVIWSVAMSRIRKDLVLGLRGVEKMVPKYRSKDTPVLGATMLNFKMSVVQFHKVMEKYEDLDLKHKFVRDLNAEEWKKLCEYDQSVTGRDRQEYLGLYYKSLDFTTGVAFYDRNGDIAALISASPTWHKEDNILKISPLFANSEEIAFSAMKYFSKVMLEKNASSRLVFHTIEVPGGSFTILRDFFLSLNVTPGVSGITLFSREYAPKGNLKKVFLAHNSSCHFDY